MTMSRTTIDCYGSGRPAALVSAHTRGVSLHSHSSFSREWLGFVPGAARDIPLACRLFNRCLAQFALSLGRPVDFESVYWRPPATPAMVVASEREQVAGRLGCETIVAVTDHDTLDGPRRLRAAGMADVPLSVEWTVMVEGSEFHLGVHGLPESKIDEAATLLAQGPAGHPGADVGGLLDWIGETPETFVVLNHPFWDFRSSGTRRHEAILQAFLHEHRGRIHALELNGYRVWPENRRVLPLAEAFGLPVVAGGDRHGHAPNAMINLTDASCFAEFAADLRAGRPTTCVIFPEYFEPIVARVFQGFREALRPDAGADRVVRSWCDRVFVSLDGEERPVASVWPGGGPWWLRGAIELTQMLGAERLRPLLRLTLSRQEVAP